MTAATTSEQRIADAMRKVVLAMERAFDDGERSSDFTIWDAKEAFLAIADELDPQ
jgi:hypothetical protein